jgi:SPP1 gp7 family putative phage head morphogenesis protein
MNQYPIAIPITTFGDAQSTHRTRAESEKTRSRFANARNAETWYGRALRRIAAAVETIIKGFDVTYDPDAIAKIENALGEYSKLLHPWAEAVSARLVEDLSRRDERAWIALGREHGAAVRHEIASVPVGNVYQQAMAEQVRLITSLPLDAAQRVHELATGSLYTGARPPEIIAEIMKTGEVTRSRATLIARTETSRASGEITSARAQYVGSPGYIWRTSRDRRVRPLHRKLEGTFHRWDDPPVSGENGERSLPGGIYQCRCYPEVLLPESFLDKAA